MSVFIDADDRVRKLHVLKRTPPSDGKVVRVEKYESDIYGAGPKAFIWDPNLPAPSPDTDARVASTVDSYGPGGGNEGAWDLLRPVGAVDAGVAIAVPINNQPRGFDHRGYDSSDEAINGAAQYCGNWGGGIVKVPSKLLPLDYGVVTVPSGVTLNVLNEATLTKFDDTDSPYTATRPSVFFGNTSSGAAELVLGQELEVSGTEVKVRRGGGNTLTISTETDATINGSASITIGSDGGVEELIYDRSNDNWVSITS